MKTIALYLIVVSISISAMNNIKEETTCYNHKNKKTGEHIIHYTHSQESGDDILFKQYKRVKNSQSSDSYEAKEILFSLATPSLFVLLDRYSGKRAETEFFNTQRCFARQSTQTLLQETTLPDLS